MLILGSWLLLPHMGCCKSRYTATPYDLEKQLCCGGRLYPAQLYKCARFGRKPETPLKLTAREHLALHRVNILPIEPK